MKENYGKKNDWCAHCKQKKKTKKKKKQKNKQRKKDFCRDSLQKKKMIDVHTVNKTKNKETKIFAMNICL